MTQSSKWTRLAGTILHALIGLVMLLAGGVKLLGAAPADQVSQMGLTEEIRLIGAGEVATAVLLLIPRTLPLGILLASSFWGGAICLHMSRNDSYAAPVVLLVLTWIGMWLRDRAMFAPLWSPGTAAPGAGRFIAPQHESAA